MQENQKVPDKENNPQDNKNNISEEVMGKEKSLIALINEINDGFRNQNITNQITNEINNKILGELVKRGKKKSYEKSGVWVQIILAGLNLLMLGVFVFTLWHQITSTKEALDRSDTANHYTREALKRADSSNKYTRKADSISEQTLIMGMGVSQTDLRPYLWYSSDVVNGIPAVGRYAPIVHFKNFGKSPAFNEDSRFFWHYGDSFDTYDFILRGVKSQSGYQLIPPGLEYEISMDKHDKSSDSLVFTQGMIDIINAGKSFLFLAVRLGYDQRIGQDTIT